MMGLIQIVQEYWNIIDRPGDAMKQVQKMIYQEE